MTLELLGKLKVDIGEWWNSILVGRPVKSTVFDFWSTNNYLLTLGVLKGIIKYLLFWRGSAWNWNYRSNNLKRN